MTDEESSLYHVGVKGMKWGKRTARGSEAVSKNQNLNKSLKTHEDNIRRAKLVGGIAAVGAAAVIQFSPAIMNIAASAASSRATAFGAAHAANLLADSRGLTSYSTIALALDSASGVWR